MNSKRIFGCVIILFILKGTLMTISDDHEHLVRLKDRIERQTRQENEAIARGRAEREKWLREESGIKDSADHSHEVLTNR